MRTFAIVLLVWFGVGLAFWLFLVWATGLGRQRQETRRDWDAEFAEVVKELRS